MQSKGHRDAPISMRWPIAIEPSSPVCAGFPRPPGGKQQYKFPDVCPGLKPGEFRLVDLPYHCELMPVSIASEFIASGAALPDQDFRRVAAYMDSRRLLCALPPPLWSRLRAASLDEQLRNDNNRRDYIGRAENVPTTSQYFHAVSLQTMWLWPEAQ